MSKLTSKQYELVCTMWSKQAEMKLSKTALLFLGNVYDRPMMNDLDQDDLDWLNELRSIYIKNVLRYDRRYRNLD